MIYVMSDIHGNKEAFDAIMAQIQLQSEDRLYVLGDVIDRNPDGLNILTQLINMPNVQMLLGNHEHMMLEVMDDPEDRYILRRWYQNGGDVTHKHWKRLPATTRAYILYYLRRLPLNIPLQVNGKDYLLVHGAPVECFDPEEFVIGDATVYAVWERLHAMKTYVPGKTIIFGHTPTRFYQDAAPMRIFHGNEMIGIDCGAAYDTGRLACLRLDDGKEFYSEPKVETLPPW